MVAAIVGAVGVAASVGGAVMSANAAENAADTQAEAARSAAQLQYQSDREGRALQADMFRRLRADQAPYRAAGRAALRDLVPGTTRTGGEFVAPFTMQDFQQDPGYQFRLQEGMKALDRTAASRGMLLSGAQATAAQDFGQGLASQEYGAAYGRFQDERTQRFNRLASLAGLGQTATAQTGQAGLQTGQSIAAQGAQSAALQGDFLTQAANARASGYVGAANAINQGIGGAMGGLNTYLTLRALQSPSRSTYAPAQAGIDF